MRTAVPILVAGLVAATATGGPAMADRLSDLRWEKRIVILFGADDVRVDQQATEFRRDRTGLADRDLLVFSVVGDELRPVYGTVPSGETPDALRDRFGIDPSAPFACVLIGKDGTEKWRGTEPVPHAEIDGIIDAMPMRRSGD